MAVDSFDSTNRYSAGNGYTNSPDFDSDGDNKQKSISNASQALDIATRLQTNDLYRDVRRARVLSAFNGSPPYDDADLLNKAQSYRYNVSFGFMEGVVGRAVVPYNDLTLNIGELTEIEADLPDAKLKIIQNEFGNAIKKWGKWPKMISRLNQDLVLNGYNCLIYPSDYDPFPTFVDQSRGYVDEGTPNDVNDVECFVWKKSYLIHELYAKIADPEVAEKAGWNVKNVRKALEQAMPEDLLANTGNTSGTWTALEKQIRGGALWASIVGARMVDTFHTFSTELDGSVTHFIVTKTEQGDDVDSPELFKKRDRFDSMSDFLVYFDLETGDGTWHGSRGLGQRSFNTHKAVDKLRCSALDQVFSSGQVILQPADQSSQEDFTLVMMGPFAVIPPGVEVSATTIPSLPQTTFAADQLLTGASEQRIGDIVPQISYNPNQAAETATAAKINAGRSAAVTTGNLKRYIDPISQAISIMVRRLLKKNSPNPFAKSFQKALKEKGLTDEELAKIRGARNTGNIQDILGNTATNTQIIFAEFRGDPDIDQIELKNRRISSVLDADAAEELIITDEDQSKVIESTRQQELELTTILQGMNVPVSPRDNHEAHLKVIFEWLGTMINQQAQNPSPEAIPMMKAVVDHGNAHLRMLGQDKTKKAFFVQAENKMDDAEDAIKTLEKQNQQMAAAAIAQAKQLATTPEQQAQVAQAEQALTQQQTAQ